MLWQAREKLGAGCYFPIIYSSLNTIAARGWSSYQPADSCKHIRDYGDSKGDGEYWIDPEKNGRPLKVFCDMTTGGGKG